MDSLNLPTSRAYWQKQTPYRSIERLLLCFMDHIKLRQIFFGHHDTINPLTPTFSTLCSLTVKASTGTIPSHQHLHIQQYSPKQSKDQDEISSMTVSKVYYYERASVFDRMLILLLGLSCIFLVNMKNNCPPCNKVHTDYHYKGGSSYISSGGENMKSFDGKSSSLKGSVKSSEGSKKTNKKQKTEKKTTDTSKAKTSSKATAGKSIQGTKGIKEGSLWKNKWDIVHIMTTRYMQLQPDLMHLGKARNDLMRVFTIPGVTNQTTQEFIWIIFTDPALNQELLDEVLDMIKPYPNIMLLGMNNGMSNFRNYGWMQNIKKVFSGDIQMLKDYQKASKRRVLLETRLDADDSIFVEMMDAVQEQAAKTMGERAIEKEYNPEALDKEYRIFCNEVSGSRWRIRRIKD